MRLISPAAFVLCLSAPTSYAATSDGAFAADGIGSQSCSAFLEAAKGQDRQALGYYASWIEGFMTGVNVFRDDTFDITPWQTAPLLMGKLGTYCAANPDLGVVVALGRLVAVLEPHRLTEPSETVQARTGGRAVAVPAAVLARVRGAIEAETGEALSTPEGSFDADFAAALRSYQSGRGLEESGLPDQRTLNALFP